MIKLIKDFLNGFKEKKAKEKVDALLYVYNQGFISSRSFNEKIKQPLLEGYGIDVEKENKILEVERIK